MAKTVCVDALVYWNGSPLAERNDTSISIDADVAEARPFVADISSAYATKTPTWKNWTASVNGFYDSTDEVLQNAIKNGTVAQLVVYPTRSNLNNYWYGNAFPTSCEQTIASEDYSELNTEFEGSGTITWLTA